ncbi:hypothetical protein TNCV_2062491 [Trichonephila clavipes]|nr:hypothetical protein TNCV_2062491 [Trichonephila clavipes]
MEFSGSAFIPPTPLGRQDEGDQTHLRPHLLNGRLCHQDADADVKTDSNPKTPCLVCMVNAASNRVERPVGHSTNMWPGVILMKESHLPS